MQQRNAGRSLGIAEAQVEYALRHCHLRAVAALHVMASPDGSASIYSFSSSTDLLFCHYQGLVKLVFQKQSNLLAYTGLNPAEALVIIALLCTKIIKVK